MYDYFRHAGNPRMVLFFLPSSSGAIAAPNRPRRTDCPAKPRELFVSFRFKEGLRDALQGVGRIDSLDVFYLN